MTWRGRHSNRMALLYFLVPRYFQPRSGCHTSRIHFVLHRIGSLAEWSTDRPLGNLNISTTLCYIPLCRLGH